MKRLICAIMVATVGTFGLTALAQEPCTITVQPGESIQAAIDAAPEGAVICLAAGEWEENLVIDKSLTLRGQGAGSTHIIAAKDDLPVVSVRSDQSTESAVFVGGVTVKWAWDRGGLGLLIEGHVFVIVEECVVSENYHGVYLRDGSRTKIVRCIVSRHRGFGIGVDEGSDAEIIGCTVSENSDGIALSDRSSVTILLSTVSDNTMFGIWLWGSVHALISDSTLSTNSWGLRLCGDSHALIRNSSIRGGLVGMIIEDFSNAAVDNCEVSGHHLDGIIIFDSARLTIHQSAINGNLGHGVALRQQPCVDTDRIFTGYITGSGNTGGGNTAGDTCPDALAFLFTEEGGELDRRDEVACMITVLPGESIQAAIDAAPEGAVICLSPGEWRENLVIEKSLTLRAAEMASEPRAVIRSAREGWPAIQIDSDEPIEVTIRGFGITGAWGSCYREEPDWICAVGISVRGSAAVVIANNIISDNQRYGIWLWDSSQTTIHSNTIIDNGIGIEMIGLSHATIKGNTISNNGSGIWMWYFSEATIEANTFSNNWQGIEMWGFSQALIHANTISGGFRGIGMVSSSQATIEGNNISDSFREGIRMERSSQATIKGNTISSNGSGIGMVHSSQATIESNTISWNWSGIWIGGLSQATVTRNVIRDNEGYGVDLYERPCIDTNAVFTGYITGRENTGGGNGEGDTCPDDLAFLFAEEGGELDRREE